MPDNFDILGLATWIVAFLFSTTCHEFAHALAGRLGGDRTADDQVTLNPVPHMRREPVGMVFMPLLSGFMSGGTYLIGWASAPYDPHWADRHPKRAALMSLAGPLANFILCGLAIVALRVLLPQVAEQIEANPTVRALVRLVLVMALLNALLGIFNLLPFPPLDGAGVLHGLGGAPARFIERIRYNPMGSMVAFVVALVLFRYIAPPIAGVVMRLVSGG